MYEICWAAIPESVSRSMRHAFKDTELTLVRTGGMLYTCTSVFSHYLLTCNCSVASSDNKVVAGSCSVPTDSYKFPTEKISMLKKINLSQFPRLGGFSPPPKFRILDRLKFRGEGTCPSCPPRLWLFHGDSTLTCVYCCVWDAVTWPDVVNRFSEYFSVIPVSVSIPLSPLVLQ